MQRRQISTIRVRQLIAAVIATFLTVTLGLISIPSATAASAVGGPITRHDVWERGAYWVHQRVPYSQSRTARDPEGRQYRTDCSGFVSMAWHLGASLATDSLSTVSTRLSGYSDLRTGDILLKPKSCPTCNDGHVYLFVEWTDPSRSTAYVMDQTPSTGARQTTITSMTLQAKGYTPWRYNNIQENPVNTPDPVEEDVEELVVPKIAVIDGTGDVQLKTGGLSASWGKISARADDVVIEGARVGVLDKDANLWVREGQDGWVHVATSVSAFDLAGDRIMVVTTGGGLIIKEGAISAEWVQAATNVADVVADGDRIGMLTRDGNFHAKDGVHGEWVLEHTNVTQIAVYGSRLAAVSAGGPVRVKEGLNGAWVTVANNGTQVALSGSRIGYIDPSGNLFVKEGSISAGWVKVATSTTSVELTDTRIGMIQTNGSINVKEGAVSAGWTKVATGVVLEMG